MAEWIGEHLTDIQSIARRNLRGLSKEEMEDVISSTILRILSHPHYNKVNEAARFSYVKICLINMSLDYKKHCSRKPPTYNLTDVVERLFGHSYDTETLDIEAAEILKTINYSMPERRALLFFMNQDKEPIPNNLKSALHRARQRTLQCLKAEAL